MTELLPTSAAELAEMIQAATAPLSLRGGATRGMEALGQALSVAGIRGVTLYEPGAMTLVCAAGTPMDEIETLLAGENQQLAFEPIDHRALLGTSGTPTIGGVIAANVSGPRRIQAGAARDSVIGLRFVDGMGRQIHNGGRVMKNVTGYDLARLVAGSRGTLGAITEVALRVLPAPEAVATLRIEVASADAAVEALSAALGSPFDVTGAAYVPGQGALVRLEGFAPSVRYRAEELTRTLARFGAVSVEDDARLCRQIWRDLRDASPFHAAPGDVWRVSVKPSDAPEIAARLEADNVFFDWGGGLIWALMPEGSDLRARLGDFSGHATLVRASQATKAIIPTLQPEPAALALLSEKLKAQFDPRGLFSARQQRHAA